MRLKVSKGEKVHFYSAEVTADICLELAGGGFTTAQTMDAMAMQDRLLHGETVTIKGFKLEMVESDNG